MDIQTLKRAKSLEACIDATNHNIEYLEKIKSCNEIIVVPNSEAMQLAIKNMHYDGKDNLAPIYITGKEKDEMLDVKLNKEIAFRNKRQKELDDL